MNTMITLELIRDLSEQILGAAEDCHIDAFEYIERLDDATIDLEDGIVKKIPDELSDVFDIVYEHYCKQRNIEPELYKTRYNLYTGELSKFAAYMDIIDILPRFYIAGNLLDEYLEVLTNIHDHITIDCGKKLSIWKRLFASKIKVHLNIDLPENIKFFIQFVFDESSLTQIVQNSFDTFTENYIPRVKFTNV